VRGCGNCQNLGQKGVSSVLQPAERNGDLARSSGNDVVFANPQPIKRLLCTTTQDYTGSALRTGTLLRSRRPYYPFKGKRSMRPSENGVSPANACADHSRAKHLAAKLTQQNIGRAALRDGDSRQIGDIAFGTAP